MKNFFLKTGLTLLCLIIGLGSAWGEEVTYEMTIDSSSSGSNNVHWTESSVSSLVFDGITWSTSVTGTSSFTASKTYAQIGSKSAPATNVTLSTTGFAGKIIKSASLTGYCMSNTGPELTITAGSTTMLNQEALVKTTPTTYTTTSAAVTLGSSDKLTFSISSSAKAAIAISKVTVVYEDAGTTSTPYTVTFDAGTNGTCSTSSLTETSVGAGVTLPSCTANTNYTFVGWSTSSTPTSADAGTAGENYKPSADCTLYAYYTYQAPSHTAHFSINGTIDNTKDCTVAEGEAITFPTSLADINGKKFVGWVTSTIEGTTKTAPTFVTSANMGTSDVTYYAVYATQTGSGSSEPTRVNSTSGLIAGNTYYIAASATYASTATAMGASTGGNNFPATSFQYAVPLTLGGNATDGWTFSYTNGGTTYYLDPTSTTSSNYLKRNESVTNYGKFSISFSSNAAVITSLGKSSRNILRYNSSSTCFSCYSSGQGDVYLFAEGGGTTYSDYCTTVGDEPTPTKTLTGIEVTGTPAEFWKGDAFNHNGMTVTAHYDDESTENVTASAEFSTPDMSTAGEKTVTVTYQNQTDTYNITVNTIANTQATAYTVARAKELIDAGKDLSTEVYVTGKISQVDSYSSTYKSITYWISTDGTTSGQFEIYGGKGLENADFSSMDDVQVGAEVIVYGKLKKFNSTYELDSNNYLVSYSYTPPTTDFIKTPTATVKVLDPISIKDYINGEYSSYDITTSIDGKTQKDYEFVCIYDQIRFCKAGTYVVDVTGTSGSDTQNGQVTFTVTPTGAELSSVTIGGTLTKTTYTVGESFDRTGLTLTANCSDGSHANVTDEAEWEADPATFTEAGTTTVVVMGTYCGESDIQEYTVTVNAAPQAVTWDLTTDNTATATANEISWTSAAVSMSDTKGTSTTDANSYYGGDSQGRTSTRFYKNSTLAFTPENGITITSIIYNATTEGYATALANSTWTNATASADGTTVTITPTNGAQAVSAIIGGTTGAFGVTVYYSGSATPATEYNINLNQNAGGTISASVAKATAGTEITLTATPNTGYVFSEWTVLDGNANEVEVINNKFVMPESDVEVEATFEEKGTQETLYLDFDFINHPANWPVNKANAAAGTYTYTLDGEDYDFTMTKSGDGIYLSGTSGTSGYLLMASGNQLGLPALDGYKLTQVVGQLNSSGTPSISSIVSVTDGTNEVSGGEGQTWAVKGDQYTYNLTGTEVNTVYYLAISNKNCQMINLKLTYEQATSKTLTSITVSGTPETFTVGDEFNHNGITVMASWSEGDDTDVTSSAEFSTPDMSTAGEKAVTVSYTYGGVTKEASYDIIVNAVTKYTVTIETPTNGTLVVKHGEDVVTSGAQFAVGEVLDITATPAEGYKFRNWQAVDGTTHTFTSGTKWTMTASDVTIKANFDPADQKYLISWNVNGTVTNQQVDAGSTLVAPTMTGKTLGTREFVGWTEDALVKNDTIPTYVTLGTATKDVTYYAVFADREEVTAAVPTSITAYADGNYYLVDKYVVGGVNHYYALDGNINSNNFIIPTDITAAVTENPNGSITIDESNPIIKDAMKYSLSLTVEGNDSTIILRNLLTNKVINKVTSSSNANNLTNNEDAAAWTHFYAMPHRDADAAKSLPEQFADPNRFTLSNSTSAEWESHAIFMQYSSWNSTDKVQDVSPRVKAYAVSNRGVQPEKAQCYSAGYLYFVPATPIALSNFATHEVSVSQYGSTTLCMPEDYVMPEGLTGKIVTAKEDLATPGYYSLTIVTKYNAGDVVPAGECLVLSGNQDSYYIAPGEASSSASVTEYPDNLLRSDYVIDTEDSKLRFKTNYEEGNASSYYYYKLTTKNSANFGWYWGVDGGAPFWMTSNERTYLVIDKEIANKVRGFALDECNEEDITTFINGLVTEEINRSGRIYNLQGQMVNKLQKGINIVNGKKVIR